MKYGIMIDGKIRAALSNRAEADLIVKESTRPASIEYIPELDTAEEFFCMWKVFKQLIQD